MASTFHIGHPRFFEEISELVGEGLKELGIEAAGEFMTGSSRNEDPGCGGTIGCLVMIGIVVLVFKTCNTGSCNCDTTPEQSPPQEQTTWSLEPTSPPISSNTIETSTSSSPQKSVSLHRSTTTEEVMRATVVTLSAPAMGTPGWTASEAFKVEQGQQLELNGVEGQWVRVSTSSGARGWVHSACVKAGSHLQSGYEILNQTVNTAVVKVKAARVRMGPSLQHETTADSPFYKGERVFVLSMEGNWLYVLNEKCHPGWMYITLLESDSR
jgi:SH3-like domain-containing protein